MHNAPPPLPPLTNTCLRLLKELRDESGGPIPVAQEDIGPAEKLERWGYVSIASRRSKGRGRGVYNHVTLTDAGRQFVAEHGAELAKCTEPKSEGEWLVLRLGGRAS